MLSENEKQRETADEKAALNRASRAVDTTRQSTTARGGRGQPRSMSAPPSAPYGTGPHGSYQPIQYTVPYGTNPHPYMVPHGMQFAPYPYGSGACLLYTSPSPRDS